MINPDRLEAAVRELVDALRAELAPSPPAPVRLLSIADPAMSAVLRSDVLAAIERLRSRP